MVKENMEFLKNADPELAEAVEKSLHVSQETLSLLPVKTSYLPQFLRRQVLFLQTSTQRATPESVTTADANA